MTPNNGKKAHVKVLVSMLNEKNQYIRSLHKKIDQLNIMIDTNKQTQDQNQKAVSILKQQQMQNESLIKKHLPKSKSMHIMNRAKSAQSIGHRPTSRLENIQEESEMTLYESVDQKFQKIGHNLEALKDINLMLYKEAVLGTQNNISDSSVTSSSPHLKGMIG